MNRIDFTNKINTCAARFVLEVEGFNATSQYHINIHAESFLIPVLNEIFGLKLENLNASQKKNFPAIDLADFENRVAFQITATANLEKIKDTLIKFSKYNLQDKFDLLYIYVITEKQGKYNEDIIQNLLPEGFSFDSSVHIIDRDVILQKINNISSTPKLQLICKLYEHEFSDVQIETRKQKFEYGYLNNNPEELFPNFLEIIFPKYFYTADVAFDEEKVSRRINDYLESIGKKTVKQFRKEKLIKNILRQSKAQCTDWILHEGKLYTFKDLNSNDEVLRYLVDQGTIESVECSYYAGLNEDTNRVFKYLLRETLREFCFFKGIEWFPEKNIFRFANNPKMPNLKRMKWKGKKEATKTVIFEMMNKKKEHIVCYRNLAFRSSFENFDDKWYLVLNPTWSFTNPGGYKTSRFEPDYMSGLKRLENNGAVYNYFRFFGYYLSYVDLFTKDYPYFKVGGAKSYPFSPQLEEKVWRPVKLPEKAKELTDIEISSDNELDSNLF